LTANELPYLHLNARSRKITSEEVKSIYLEEISWFLPRGVDRQDYLRKVML
jgi:hypothetical protein